MINVPMVAYEEIDGFIIPGFLSRREGVPNPPIVREKLNQKFSIQRVVGDVETETFEKVETDPDTFSERVNEITDEQAEVSLYLLEQEKWDFFITVFMGTDRIQHFLWKHIDKSHPEYEENQHTEKVKQHYKKVDRIIDRFLEAAPKNTITILLSDHGFCPIQKEVLINNYLQEIGMLKARRGKIDLERSRVVSYGYGDIWLNVKDREPKGIIKQGKEYEETREEIIEAFENLKIDQQNPIKKVKRREEIYWGPHLNEAPDLTIIFNPGWQAARRPEIQTEKRPNKRYIIDNPRWSGGHDGTHDPADVPGIIGILGPGILSGKEVKVHLWDAAPARAEKRVRTRSPRSRSTRKLDRKSISIKPHILKRTCKPLFRVNTT